MARTKATTRNVIATAPEPPPATREDAVIAALVQERAKATAAPTVARIQVTLTPGALDALDGMQYLLKRSGFRVSASALVEAALLELYLDHESGPAKIAAVVRRHVGEHAARRRAT